MINNITKYFSRTSTHNIFNNKGPLTAVNNVKLQHHKIKIINRILVNFFKKFYVDFAGLFFFYSFEIQL